MMNSLNRCAVLAVLGLAVFARADDTGDGKTISATDTAAIAAAKDSTATVQGKISSCEWSKSGKVCTIEFENSPGFTSAAFAKSKDKLDAAFGGDFAKKMVGATIKLTGKIEPYGGHDDTYKDAMQIIIKTTSQITVVTPSSQPSTQASTQPST